MSKPTSKNSIDSSSVSAPLAFWSRERYFLAFFTAALALSFSVPWLELQGKSMSGLSVLLSWSSADPMLHTAFWHPVSLGGIAVLIVFTGVLSVLGFREVTLGRTATLALIWALALLSIIPVTFVVLNTQSDNVKQVVYILGYWLTLFGSASVFVYSLVLMAHIDTAEQRPTGWLEIALPAVFVAVSVVGALINYKWVNYELVPPATKIVRSTNKAPR